MMGGSEFLLAVHGSEIGGRVERRQQKLLKSSAAGSELVGSATFSTQPRLDASLFVLELLGKDLPSVVGSERPGW